MNGKEKSSYPRLRMGHSPWSVFPGLISVLGWSWEHWGGYRNTFEDIAAESQACEDCEAEEETHIVIKDFRWIGSLRLCPRREEKMVIISERFPEKLLSARLVDFISSSFPRKHSRDLSYIGRIRYDQVSPMWCNTAKAYSFPAFS